MSTAAPIDDELALVAVVAAREGWRAGAPPAEHPPRTLAEQRAVARHAGAAAAAPGGRAAPRGYEARARVALVVLSVLVLGACWWVSPERTALGLLGAGLVCLVAMRRRRRTRDRSLGIGGVRRNAGSAARPW